MSDKTKKTLGIVFGAITVVGVAGCIYVNPTNDPSAPTTWVEIGTLIASMITGTIMCLPNKKK